MLSSTLNTTTEVRPLSKAPYPQLLPGCRNINGCPLLRVCVCVCVCLFTTHCCVCSLGWVKCRAQIPSMGHHTWPHVTSFPSFSNTSASNNSLPQTLISFYPLLPQCFHSLSKGNIPMSITGWALLTMFQ